MMDNAESPPQSMTSSNHPESDYYFGAGYEAGSRDALLLGDLDTDARHGARVRMQFWLRSARRNREQRGRCA